MRDSLNRRDFLQLAGLAGAGVAGVVFASGSHPSYAVEHRSPWGDFVFLQMSDTHWGFSSPIINPDAAGTLEKAVAAVNTLDRQPDFVVFTGDLTHTTEDPEERRKRLAKFRDIAAGLRVEKVYFMPGEHDAALDGGEAYREFFGDSHYTFDHKGVHFVVLDNVSDPTGAIGRKQLDWLRADLAQIDREIPVVVLTHRPLFDLAPDWDWWTPDGAEAIRALSSLRSVTVFYGHIHQEHHHQTGSIAHHAAKGLMFALPPPMSVPNKAPIPWQPHKPYAGLGFRTVQAASGALYTLTEWPVVGR